MRQITFVIGSPCSGKTTFLNNYRRTREDIILQQPIVSKSQFGSDFSSWFYYNFMSFVKDTAQAANNTGAYFNIITDTCPWTNYVIQEVFKGELSQDDIVVEACSKAYSLEGDFRGNGIEVKYYHLPLIDAEEICNRMLSRDQSPNVTVIQKYYEMGLVIERVYKIIKHV